MFTKTGALRYIGHLDLQTLWERAARRASLPLAYSHGFHPQPKINFASALPLGYSSRAEVLDMRLQEDMEPAELRSRLMAAMPDGISVLDVRTVDEAEPALQMQVTAAEYEVTVPEDGLTDALQRGLERLLGAETLPRVRREKPYDLRPLIEELRIVRDGTGTKPPRLFMRLTAREGATGRPDEVLDELGIALRDARVERTRLIFGD